MTAAPGLKGKPVLVIGAGGFIGAALTSGLVALGARVHGVSRNARPAGGPGVTWWQSDLQDIDEVRRLLDAVKPDVVYHLAGHVSAARGLDLVLPTFQASVVTTVNLLTAASEKRCGRIVLTASLEEPEHAEGWPVPASPYAAAKYAANTYARMFHTLYGTPLVVLRIFMAYGPAQANAKKLVPYATRALLRNEAPRLSSAQRRVDWVYMDDVVEACVAAADAAGVEGRTIDIGSGVLVTVKETVEQLVRIIRPSVVPVFGAAPDGPPEAVRVARPEDAAALLGWRARTPLEDGLRRTVDWYRHALELGDAAASAEDNR